MPGRGDETSETVRGSNDDRVGIGGPIMKETDEPASPGRIPVRINDVSVDHTGTWLQKGWRDVRDAPLESLLYGGFFTAVGYLLTFGLHDAGLGSLVLPLSGGFLLIAPILAVGLYSIAREREAGRKPTFLSMWAGVAPNFGQIAIMGVLMMMFFFWWALIARALFAIFFVGEPLTMDHFVRNVLFSTSGIWMIAVGTVVGGILAGILFSMSVVSIPLLLDRDIDVATAITVSILVCKHNPRAMFGWAAALGVISAFAMALFFIGLAVALPMLAYASWHAYRDLVTVRDGAELDIAV